MFWPIVLACAIAGFGLLGAASALLQPPAAQRPPAAAPAVEVPRPPARPAAVASAPPTVVVVSYDVFDAHDARARRTPDWLVNYVEQEAALAQAGPDETAVLRSTPARASKPQIRPAQRDARNAAPAVPLVSRPAAGVLAAPRPTAEPVVAYRAEAAINTDASRFVLVHVTDTNAWVRVDGTRTIQVRVGETIPGLGVLQAVEAGRARFSQGVLALGIDAASAAETR